MASLSPCLGCLSLLAFDTRGLAAGVYVVRAEQPSGATTTRLTVVR
ncbi:MAG: hypothetical protein AAFP18_18280 [Bacteroidota bacterium]